MKALLLLPAFFMLSAKANAQKTSDAKIK